MKPSGSGASADHKLVSEPIVIPASSRWMRVLGWLGVLLAAPFFLWIPLAALTPLPSMIDVFGIVGMRIPASVTVAGLLLAAIGFHRF
jgi:hypothetical protein